MVVPGKARGRTITDHAPKRTKLRGIIRSEIERIESMLRAGFTIDGIAQTLEEEVGIAINRRTFQTALSAIRAERREGKKWIAHHVSTKAPQPTIKPDQEPEPPPTPQPERDKLGEAILPKQQAVAPQDDLPLTAEDKKRRLAEATRAPIPDLEKYLSKHKWRR